MKSVLAFALAFLLCGLQAANAQVAENTTLFKEVMALDRQLFDEGFNKCKLDVLDKYVGPNLEFFHDKGGIQNRSQFFEAVKKNICANPNGKPIRTLMAGSSQVFPLENNGVLYGAVQVGIHRFDTQGADIAKEGYTIAKFTHVWLLRNAQWQLKSAISYDHQHKDGKLASKHAVKKALLQPLKLFELTIASLTVRLYSWE